MSLPLIVLSGAVAALNVAPFCWQLQHNNSGPVCQAFWLILQNLMNFVDTLAWRDNVQDSAPVWCDIDVRLRTAAPIGTTCSNLCIMAFLAEVVSPNSHTITVKDRKRRRIFDYTFCLLVPLIISALQTLVQPTRYGIVRGQGCASTWTNSWPLYTFYVIWQPIFAFVGCLLSVFVIVRLLIHRHDFKKLVTHSNSALTTSRFLRLTGLGVVSIALNSLLAISIPRGLVQASGQYVDYDWEMVHRAFSQIMIRTESPTSSVNNWGSVMGGVAVLLFFGFGSEALSYYARVARFFGLGAFLEASQRALAHTRAWRPRRQPRQPRSSHVALQSWNSKRNSSQEISVGEDLEYKDSASASKIGIERLSRNSPEGLQIHVYREENVV